MLITALSPRQFDDGGSAFDYDSTSLVWYIAKWAIIGALVIFFIGYWVGGYAHAKRRMKKGLPLLRYHRWLIPRRTRAQYESRFNPPQNSHTYHNSYQMHPYGGVPPPAYNPETDYVPPYAPPEGSSKVNPDQQGTVQTHEVGETQHAPPPGPPPSHMAGSDPGERSGLRQPSKAATSFRA